MTTGNAKQQSAPLGSVVRYIFLGLLFLTWVFWNVAVFHCTFIRWGGDDTDYKDMNDRGFFTAPAYDKDDNLYACVRYDPDTIDDFDGARNAARFFGAFGYIMHTLAFFIAVLVELFVHQRVRLIWMVVRVLIIISAVCSVLIFTVFATEDCEESDFSDVKCVPGPAGIVAIFNIVFIIAALVLSWFIQAPGYPFFYIRRWHETAGEAEKTTAPDNDSKIDPTQNMNDDTQNLDSGNLPPPPTMDYIETETTKPAMMEAEAEA